ncbi:MAG: glycosyltransferase family 2 protein [Solirubrobacterales bacterium]
MAEVAIIVESYNETEHSTPERLAESLGAATRESKRHGSARVLLADSAGSEPVARLVRERFPQIERVATGDCGYDIAKVRTAEAAGTPIVAYLDGDCIPAPGWLTELTRPIVEGQAVVTTGMTRYEGGFLPRVATVLDFGFLLPARARPVGCYASNNAAFLTESLLEVRPEGELRCNCFAHSQVLARRGTPPQLVPTARVIHEFPPIRPERLRRGYELVAAAQQDPELREARWLRFGLLSTPLFLLYNLQLDVRRLVSGGADSGLGGAQRLAALPVIVALRLIDLRGIVAALRGRPVPG